MNRTWIAALSIAGVAGTGGAAYAGLATPTAEPAPETTVAPAVETTAAPIHRVVDFQIGTAATIRVEQIGDSITITGVATADGWASLGTAGSGTHAEALIGNGVQLVTFSADLIDGEIVPSVGTADDPSVTSTIAEATTTTADVTVVTIADPTTTTSPAEPPTTTPDATAPTTVPGPETTTAPSGGHEDDDEDEDEDHDEDEDEDHEDEDHADEDEHEEGDDD